ncbi:MAG: DNA primase [Agitococcus sp.]|nr:DNA primase [Agitococcus sp.]
MAGRIPQNFIDEVLRRTDIVDLISGQVRLKKTGKNYSACCPFHNEKSPSFSVNREKQFYHCFGCGASGNALSFVMQYEHREFIDGLEYLAQKVGLSLPETSQQETQVSRQPLYDILEAAAQFFEEQLRTAPNRDKAVSYLQQRGLTGQIAKDWRVGYAPAGWDNLFKALADTPEKQALLLEAGLIIHQEQRDSYYDAMRERVIFPIRDFRGRVIAFGGRVLDDSKPKYLNSPESPIFHKGEELYGFYESRQAKQALNRIMVVEGYLDVIAVHQAGLPFAVATLGTATSTTHVERLFRSVSIVVFCFDGDNAGRKAAWRALESALPALKEGVSASFLFLPDGQDPDSLIRQEHKDAFNQRISSALPLADFLFNHLSEDLNLESLEGKSRLASLAKPLIDKVPVGVYRQLLWQRLSQLTGLDEQTLKVALPTAIAPTPITTPNEEPVVLATRPVRRQYEARTPNRPQSIAGKLSWSDKAIQLLLQDAAIATALDTALLLNQLPSESALLLDVIDFCQQHTDCTAFAILGAWEGTAEGAHLKALAEDAPFLSAIDTLGEMTDILNQLRIDNLKKRRKETTELNLQVQIDKELRSLTHSLKKKPE